jgi:hypothetical protein
VLVQNTGGEIPWTQGTPVKAYLPPEALRVLTDTGAALAPLDQEAATAGPAGGDAIMSEPRS